MKLPALLLLLVTGTITAAGDGYIQNWFKAEEHKKAGNREAELEARLRCFEQAVEAKDTNYAYPAASTSVFIKYNAREVIEAGKLAREVFAKLQTLPPDRRLQAVICRCQVLMILERGLHAQGRIGDGWRASNAIADTLRGKTAGPDEGGTPLTVAEVLELPATHRATAWRCLTRHAEYLDIAGRPMEALALLAEAERALKARWREIKGHEVFYAFKLRSAFAQQLDYVGYSREALDLERELLELTPPPDGPAVALTLKINHLRNLSQWHGPSEELLRKARETGDAMIAAKSLNPGNVARLLARMELDLRNSESAISTLAKAIADNESAEEWFEANYARRDSMSARSRNGEVIPDSEFHELLEGLRSQGNKRGEPSVYRLFASHLARQERFDGALVHMRHAYRLDRTFGLEFHAASTLARILDIQIRIGDPAAILAAHAELEAFLATVENLPAERFVRLAVPRTRALVALGREADARRVMAEAEKMGHGLPEHLLAYLSPKVVESIFSQPTASTANASPAQPPPYLQPLETTSVASPGRIAKATFVVVNASSSPASGEILATGPGATIRKGRIVFEPGSPVSEVSLPLRIATGDESIIEASAQPSGDAAELAASLRWKGSDEPTRWDVAWTRDAENAVVLDASLIKGDPFRSLLFHHAVQLPTDADHAAVRIVAPERLRIEYYDPRSSQLLAVDANGNGDFSEEGDLHLRGPGGVAAAWITAESAGSIAIRLFGVDGAGAAAFGDPLVLRTEVFHDGDWVLEAENVLR